MQVLGDKDLIPCTKYKGLPMDEVPAWFYLWLYKKAHPLFRRKYYAVMQYIEKNLETLKNKNNEKQDGKDVEAEPADFSADIPTVQEAI